MRRLSPAKPLPKPVLGIPRLVGQTADGRPRYRVLLPAIAPGTAAALERARRLGHAYNGPTADGGHSFTARIPVASRLVPPSITDMAAAGTGDSIAPYSSVSDGYIRSSDATYATAVAGAALVADAASAQLCAGQIYTASTYFLYKSFLYTDTSAIGVNSVVTAASWFVYVQTDASDTDFNLTVVGSTAADPFTTADWGNAGAASFGAVSTVGISTAAYTEIPLNALGRGNINKAGACKWAFRSHREIAGTVPTGAERLFLYSSDQTGTANDPYLSVTYTVYNLAVEGSTSDGRIESGHAVYATARSGGTLAVNSALTTVTVGQLKPGDYYLYRSFHYFDTSSIAAGATIVNAVLYVIVQADASDIDFNITAVSSTAADPLTTNDWGNCGSADGGNVGTSGIVAEQMLAITFNATGKGFITTAGTTKIALRSSRDISATAPTGNEYIQLYSQDAAAGRRPVLAVDYTPATLITVADSCTATDAIGGITVALTVTDASTAADALGGITANLTVADTATATDDVGGITAQVTVVDAATAVDGVAQITVNLTVADSSTAVDAVEFLEKLYPYIVNLQPGSYTVVLQSNKFVVNLQPQGRTVNLP